MSTATIDKWNNLLEYDASKLEELYEKIDDTWSQVDMVNDYYEQLHGGIGHYSVCNLCGRIIAHSIHGFGSKCYKTIISILPKIAQLDLDFAQEFSKYRLLKWDIYSNTIKDLWISINTKDGKPKKFRKVFK